LPQVEGYSLHGLIGPAVMPEDAVKRLNAEVLAGL